MSDSPKFNRSAGRGDEVADAARWTAAAEDAIDDTDVCQHSIAHRSFVKDEPGWACSLCGHRYVPPSVGDSAVIAGLEPDVIYVEGVLIDPAEYTDGLMKEVDDALEFHATFNQHFDNLMAQEGSTPKQVAESRAAMEAALHVLGELRGLAANDDYEVQIALLAGINTYDEQTLRWLVIAATWERQLAA